MADTKVSFRLLGDSFEPRKITARMGVEPTDSHSKGGEMGPRATAAGLAWRSSFWCVELPKGNACTFADDIVVMLDMLPTNAAQIANDAGAEADIVVSIISDADDQPNLFLTHEAARRLAEARIGLTLYL